MINFVLEKNRWIYVLIVLWSSSAAWYVAATYSLYDLRSSSSNFLSYDLSQFDRDPSKVFCPSIGDRKFWDGLSPTHKPIEVKESQVPALKLDASGVVSVGTSQLCFYPNNTFWIPLVEKAIESVIEEQQVSKQDGSSPYMVGLHITVLGAKIANSLVLLEPVLDPRMVSKAKKWLSSEILSPFLKDYNLSQYSQLHWARSSSSWVTGNNNWVAVCTANILFICLAIEEDKDFKNDVLGACLHLSRNYLNYFEYDGACPGGIRYWTYGFYYYAMMAERVLQATGGRINLYNHPRIANIVPYSLNTLLAGYTSKLVGYYPIFGSNSNPENRPDWVLSILQKRFIFPEDTAFSYVRGSVGFNFYHDMIISPYRPSTQRHQLKTPGHYAFYQSNGLYVGRDHQRNLYLAFKGGNNAEEHNHNDVGSYTLFGKVPNQLGLFALLGDLGVGLYQSEHFSKETRYIIEGMGSHGHPLPVIGGVLQSVGSDSFGTLINDQTDPSRGIITIDLTRCYDLPGLKSLVRRVSFINGTLTVRDEYSATYPIPFETLIPTRMPLRKVSKGMVFSLGGYQLDVLISTSRPYVVKSKPSSYHEAAQLVSISLEEGSKDGFIEYSVSLPNGG